MTELNQRLENFKADKLALVGFLFDKNSSFLAGTATAPPLIREALYSDARNLWTESGVDLSDRLIDYGDIDFSEQSEFAATISATVDRVMKARHKLISLGGDHSITYPIVKALRGHYDDLNILQIDAHPDLYENFQENRYSHASPFARIMEDKLVSRLLQVGIRTFNAHQREQARRYGVQTIEMKDCRHAINVDLPGPIYISIDIDALDPAFAPGVSHPEPGGFSTRDVIEIIQSIKAPVVAADIVEFNPRRDVAGITAVAAAKLVKEIAARMI